MTNTQTFSAPRLEWTAKVSAVALILLWSTALARALGGARHSLPDVLPVPASAAAAATVLWACLAWSLLALAKVQRERDRLRDLFGKFVPPSVVAAIETDTQGKVARPCEVTVLLADIRDFTNLAETMEPEALMAFLNDYFSRLVAIVQRNGGFVDKFMGDGLLAVFGAPTPLADHAERAAACALEMHFQLGRFNAERTRSGLAAIRFGVALNSGTAAAGMIGSADRHEYTVVGDIVNTVSRLEGLNSTLGTELLVTEPTYRATSELFAYRHVGLICVKGRQAPIGVYQLLGPALPLPPALSGYELADRLERRLKARRQVRHRPVVLDPA